MLDQFNAENLLNQEALSVVRHCFELGFIASILIGLFNSLNRLCIKNEPVASAVRLIAALEKVKTLLDLEKAVIRTSSRLKTLKSELAESQGILEAMRKDASSILNRVEDKANQSIEYVANQTVDRISQFTDNVKNVETQGIASIHSLATEIEARLVAHEQSISEYFINNSYAFQILTDTHRGQITEYGKLMEEMGEMKPWIDLASILYGTYQDPQQLQRVNLPVLRRIVQGVHLYVAGKWPTERISAPREVSDRDFGIFTGSEINLVSASALLVEGLKKLERQGKV